MAVAKKAKKGAKKPSKKVAKKLAKKGVKKAAKKSAKKPAKKGAKKAAKKVNNVEMQKRMKEAEKLLIQMRDAGIPASRYEHGYHKNHANHKIHIHRGEMVLIHGLHGTPGSSYKKHTAGGPAKQRVVLVRGKPVTLPEAAPSKMVYHHPGNDGIVTVHIKSDGQTLVRTGLEAKLHAHEVLGKFHKG